MKKMMKIFVSLLVVAMVIVLMPMQQVKATEYVFIPDSNATYEKSDFEEELLEGEGFYTQDAYGAQHEYGYGYFKDGDKAGEAIFSLVYLSDRLDNKADYFVVETMYPSNLNVVAGEQWVWEILGEDAIYLEFPYNIENYNDPYLYLCAGIVDTKTGYVDGINFKVKNPYYSVPIVGVYLEQNVDVAVGESEKMYISYAPENTTMETVMVWTSSNEEIVTVDANGVITGVGLGTATVTATAVNGVSNTSVVTVANPIESMKFENDVYNVTHFSNQEIKLMIEPNENFADIKDIEWTVADENVAIVQWYGTRVDKDSAILHTVGPGTTTITATAPNGVSANCVVNVDAPISRIYFDWENEYFTRVGLTVNLMNLVRYNPENTNYDKSLIWTSSDETVATVDENGVVTAVSVGTSMITATAVTGVSDSIEIRVGAAIEIEKLKLPEEIELFLNDVYECEVEIVPSYVTIPTDLSWTSSNENVVKVDENGVVTAVGLGEAKITVTSVNGVSSTMKVCVLDGVLRIFGDNRYDTAYKVADAFRDVSSLEKYRSVIIASGTNFADALAGSYLSAQFGAPILMVDKNEKNIDSLVAYVKENLDENGFVYVLGGTSAVSDKVDKKIGLNRVIRLAGTDRYHTNMYIVSHATYGVYEGPVIVCTGTNFADSLSVSATGLPILLVGKGLTFDQGNFLSSNNVSEVIIVGGEAAVDKKVERQIRDYLNKGNSNANIRRIAGSNRYETSVLVANEFFPNATKVVLAYAKNYPDGLSGGALAFANKAPLLLTDSTKYNVTSQYTKNKNISGGYVLGGNTLVTNQAVRSIFKLSNNQSIKNKE